MSLVVPFEDLFSNESGLLSSHRSWKRIELGQVLSIVNGFAFKSELFSKNSGFPLIRIRDIIKNKTETFYAGEYSNEYIVCSGDLLVGMDGNFLCSEWCGERALLNQRVCKLIPNENYVNKKFLLYGINGYLSAIQNATSSVTVGHLSSKDILRIPFPLPPLTEQQRIVAKLEKLMAKLDQCKARLEKIPTILKRFRQSVLAAACSGELTKGWRKENTKITPADQLMKALISSEPEKYLDIFELSSDCILPLTWCWVPLGRLGIFLGGGTPSKSNPDFWSGTIPWVSPKDMKKDVLYDSIDHISEEALLNSSTKLVPEGSILFVIRGMILNHTLPVALTKKEMAINQDMKALVPEFPNMRMYLLIASKFLSSKILFFVKESTHGTRRLETALLKNWAFPIPPLAEQEQIVRRVEALFKFADQIEERYNKAKAYVDKLTQSILAKAFRGELVPQDPNDPPASELLERIKAEKKEIETQRPDRRKKTKELK
jgi:type I restriction enzyme S subunit